MKIHAIIFGLISLASAASFADQVSCNVKVQTVAQLIAQQNGLKAQYIRSSWSSNNQFVIEVDKIQKLHIVTSDSNGACAIESIVIEH